MLTLTLFALLFLFLYLGVPIAISLGLSVLVAYALFVPLPLLSVAQKFYTSLDSFPLMAIPFFVLASNLMATGGVARRLISVSTAFVGHFTGGLATAGILACMFFAAISGSSPATVIAIGGIMIPAMVRAGYDWNYAVGSMTNAGTLGILIPPSIPMIVYAVATEQSVGKLFMAGFAPGIVLGLMLIGVSYVVARRKGFRLQARMPWRERGRALREAGWSLFMPVLILGGIYGIPEGVAGRLGIEGGAIFTPTEAAAVAVVYAFLVGALIHRELGWRDIRRVLIKSAATTAMLMFIIAAAMLFGFILTSEQIPRALADWIIGMRLTPWVFLLVLNLILILAGDFMEPSSIILILAPIFLPAAIKLGIDPIHLGIIFTVNMEVGMITPPVGLNLYVASGITGRGLYEVMWASLPWMLVLVAALGVVTYVPELSLAFPRWLYGARF